MGDDRGRNPKRETASGHRLPPPSVWLTIILCAVLIGLLQSRPGGAEQLRDGALKTVYLFLIDPANVNIFTLILGFLAVMTLAIWYVGFSAYSRATRYVPAVLAVAALIVAVVTLRIEKISGELVPTFTYRWAPAPDRLLEAPAVKEAEAPVDLTIRTDADFPQFLGPDRNLVLARPKLARNWSSDPPHKIWRQAIGAGWSAFAAVNGFAVTLEQRGEDELVTCYEIETGNLRWSHGVKTRHSTLLGGIGPRSTPTINEGRVYALGATGVLRCLDGTDGRPLWMFDVREHVGVSAEQDEQGVAWGRAASPLIANDLCIVPGGGPPGGPFISLLALDKHTGSVVWQGGDRQISYASPTLGTLGGIEQIAIVNESSATGHRLTDGRTLWAHDWPGSSSGNASVSQAVVLPDDRVLLSKGYGGGATLFQVQSSGGAQWHTKTLWAEPSILKTKLTNVVVHEGFAYGLSDGILECVELRSGRRAWKKGRFGHGQILAVGDNLLVQEESGDVTLVALSPHRFDQLGSFPALDGSTWNNLCFYTPYLLVRNAEEAACYQLPLR